MISVENLSKSFKTNGQVKDVLKNITFEIEGGEVVGLLGSNGAGKTTLLKSLSNLIEPDEGVIKINNYILNHKNRIGLRFISTVLEGNRNIYWRLTVKENVEYFLGIRGISYKLVSGRLDEMLCRFKLYDKKNELVKNLSRGMQQKVAIIIALMTDSKILILDEPTLGLDVESNQEMKKFLMDVAKFENKTIIISSHDMSLIESICSRIIIVNKGEIIRDSSIENLLELFKMKSYLFKMFGTITKNQKEILSDFSDLIDINMVDDTNEFNVTFSQKNDFYLLIDLLKELDLYIEGIERNQINFETVFLSIIRNENFNVLV